MASQVPPRSFATSRAQAILGNVFIISLRARCFAPLHRGASVASLSRSAKRRSGVGTFSPNRTSWRPLRSFIPQALKDFLFRCNRVLALGDQPPLGRRSPRCGVTHRAGGGDDPFSEEGSTNPSHSVADGHCQRMPSKTASTTRCLADFSMLVVECIIACQTFNKRMQPNGWR